MRNAITVSALLLASVVMNGVAAAQTSGPQITITPTTAQSVITGSPSDLRVPFVCSRSSIQLSQVAPAVEQ
jgi:hypothetical protein